MSADVIFITRSKELGFYQNDSKNKVVSMVDGWAAFEMLGTVNAFMILPYGTTVLSKDNQMGHIIETEDELMFYLTERIRGKHYELYERVDSMYFSLLDKFLDSWVSSNEEWDSREVQRVKDQVKGLKEIGSKIDFDNNYCYVVFSC